MALGNSGRPQDTRGQRDKSSLTTHSALPNAKTGMDVRAHSHGYSVGTDAVDSYDAATATITAASHSARAGDIIRMTSGTSDGAQFTVHTTDTNTITLHDKPETDLSASDTFTILRLIVPLVTSTGAYSTSITYTYNGASQEVVEDTGTPANNRPLPVKLSSVTGDINITANDLNVALDSANDSVECIQDTHDDLNVNANIQVGDADASGGNPVPTDVISALPSGTNSIGAVTVNRQTIADPTYVNFSSSNLPGNATNPLELVASLASTVTGIQVADTGGVFMELMTGAAAAETRVALIGPGSDSSVPLAISSGTRVSIRRVDDAAALTSGEFMINFLV